MNVDRRRFVTFWERWGWQAWDQGPWVSKADLILWGAIGVAILLSAIFGHVRGW